VWSRAALETRPVLVPPGEAVGAPWASARRHRPRHRWHQRRRCAPGGRHSL